jgi:hypothetical protein
VPWFDALTSRSSKVEGVSPNTAIQLTQRGGQERTRCKVIGRVRDAAGSEVVQIDAKRPWGVDSVEGATRFEVFGESLVEE